MKKRANENEKDKNKRELNMIFNLNKEKSYYVIKMSIPTTWVQQMGITPEEKGVIATFDGKEIKIVKREKS